MPNTPDEMLSAVSQSPASARLRPGGGPGQATHTVSLRAVGEVDDEVRHLLSQAYEQNA